MSELTATVAETRANFSRIAATVNETGRPVTVFRNSRPWVVIAPVGSSGIPRVDWSRGGVVPVDESTGHALLPAEWDEPEDEGLYDDLA